MTPERWREVTAIFHAALERDAAERAAFVVSRCGADEQLRREVEAMLDGHAAADVSGATPVFPTPQPFDSTSSRELRALTPGSRLGHYEIVSLLGIGGMGEVYRARDHKLHRDVAIKVLLPAVASDPDRLARFAREARILASLNHPNIAHVHAFDEIGSMHALVMEFVDGTTLADRIARGPLSICEALDVARQIALALEAAHEQGLVHRDLKPANIKLRSNGDIKVLDFGLAKLVESTADGDISRKELAQTRTGVVVGTAPYMSPEQVKARPVDRRSDMWAFGCVMFEALAGKRAFAADTAPEMLVQILEREPDWHALPSETPASTFRLLRRCLEKDVRKRLDSAAVARIEIEDSLSDPSAHHLIPPDRARVKRRLWTRLAVAALLVAVASSAFVLGQRNGTIAQPMFTQLTFPRGYVTNARFSPDGQIIYYSASVAGARPEVLMLQTTRPGVRESRALDIKQAVLASVSSINMLAVINPSLVLSEVPVVGGAPRPLLASIIAADWTSDGKTLAVARRVGGRMQVELPADNILYETSRYISYIRVSPRGNSVAFLEHPRANDDRGDLMLVDSDRRKVTLAGGFDSIQGLAWAPDREEIWFAGSRGGVRALRAITLDGAAERVVLRAPGHLTLHDISADGKLLVDQPTRRRGIIGRAPDATGERELSWLDGSNIGDISADGRTLLFSETNTGGGPGYSVYLRTTDGELPVRLGDGIGLALSPNRQWALTTTADSTGLFQLPTGVGSRRRVAIPDLECARALWLPSGREAVLISRDRKQGQGLRAYVVNLESGHVRPITPAGVPTTSDVALSPDGKRLAAPVPSGRVWLYPIDGVAEPKPLSEAERAYVPVAWRSDSRAIYLRRGADPTGLYVHDLENGTTDLVREIGLADRTLNITDVRVAADGHAYFYGYFQLASELFLVEGVQ